MWPSFLARLDDVFDAFPPPSPALPLHPVQAPVICIELADSHPLPGYVAVTSPCEPHLETDYRPHATLWPVRFVQLDEGLGGGMHVEILEP